MPGTVGILGAWDRRETARGPVAKRRGRADRVFLSGDDSDARARVAVLLSVIGAATLVEASGCEMVLLAVPWKQTADALHGLPRWEGRALIDATNQRAPDGGVDDLGGQTGSERIASLAPGAFVIKAFNTMYARFITEDPRHQAGRRVLFYAGDDTEVKQRFSETVDGFGFFAVDIGSLADSRPMRLDGYLSALHVLRQPS